MLKVMVGCDPEGFIVRKDGKFQSAAGFFPGTKKEPHKLEGGAVQVDGVALEFNIDAVEDEEGFLKNMSTVMTQLDALVKDRLDADHSLSWTPIARFTEEDWAKIDKEAKVLGCDPDYNAMTGEVNVNPTELLGTLPLRTASGHIHLGWTGDKDPQDEGHKTDCKYIAQGFYNRFTPPYYPNSVNKSYKDEMERLKYYGHSGSYRVKPYGVELRSPSNVWVGTPQGQLHAYRTTRQIFKALTGF